MVLNFGPIFKGEGPPSPPPGLFWGARGTLWAGSPPLRLVPPLPRGYKRAARGRNFLNFSNFGFFLAKHTKPTPKKNLKPAAPPPVPPGLRAGGTPPSPPCQPPALRGGAGFEGAGDPPSPEFWGLGKLGTSPPQVFGFGRGSGRRGDTLICPFHHPPWWHPRIPALYSPAPDFGV